MFRDEHQVEQARLSHAFQHVTCNEAEYHGLIAALEYALGNAWTQLEIYSDSKLLVYQTMGRWRVKADHLKPLHRTVSNLCKEFQQLRISWVPREHNRTADFLANQAMDKAQSSHV